MGNRQPFGQASLCIYRFASQSECKNSQIESFLIGLQGLCDYQMIDSLDEGSYLSKPGLVGLFLVSAISDFDVLRNLDWPETAVKIVAYFLTEEEFRQVDVKAFRSPLKARSYRLIYPDERSISGLIYPSWMKAFDTIYARTLRNKFQSIQLATDIFSYTKQDPKPAIAEIKEMGWYLRDMGLNHADSFAGGIAIRFGEGFLVTASFTDKYQIESDRICYIENYVPPLNQVQVVGAALPSSESALAFLAFQEFPLANLMLHFHFKPMTTSPKLRSYRTSHYASYGTLREAEAVLAKLRETGNFAIAHGHGEFVIGKNFAETAAIIDQMLSLI